jgi:hypothetical protein
MGPPGCGRSPGGRERTYCMGAHSRPSYPRRPRLRGAAAANVALRSRRSTQPLGSIRCAAAAPPRGIYPWHRFAGVDYSLRARLGRHPEHSQAGVAAARGGASPSNKRRITAFFRAFKRLVGVRMELALQPAGAPFERLYRGAGKPGWGLRKPAPFGRTYAFSRTAGTPASWRYAFAIYRPAAWPHSPAPRSGLGSYGG